MFAITKSLARNNIVQVFLNDRNFIEVIPMDSKSESGNALEYVFKNIGVLNYLHKDGKKEFNLGKWKEVCDKQGIIKKK